MGKHVKWTDREELQVAKRAQEIRDDPERESNRMPTGHRCKSLPSCYALAQQLLPAERRKHPQTFHAMGAERLAAVHKSALAHLKREEELAQAEAARAAAEREHAERERTPPAPPPDPLAPLKVLLVDVLTQAVAEGIMRAAAALDIPIRTAADDAAHGGNGSGEHHASIAAVAQVLASRTHRTPVDVVGLKGAQETLVKNSPVAAAFDIRFIPADSHMRNRDVREHVVICSKFVNHSTQNRYKAGHSSLYYANGGPQSVIEQLEKLVRGSNGSAQAQH